MKHFNTHDTNIHEYPTKLIEASGCGENSRYGIHLVSTEHGNKQSETVSTYLLA